jgi:hypothetical protein
MPSYFSVMITVFTALTVLTPTSGFAAETYIKKQIVVGASSTLSPLMQRAFSGFGLRNNVNVHQESKKGLPDMLQCLTDHTCDICLYPIAPGTTFQPPIQAEHFSWGAVAFIVNKDVKLDNLNSQQVQQILSGNYTSWKPLTNQDIPIKFIYGAFGPGLAKGFFGVEKIAGSRVDSGSEAMVQVRHVSGAITHGPIELIRKMKIENFRVLRLDGIEPNVDNKSYPLRVEYVLLRNTTSPNHAQVDSIISYALNRRDETLIKGEMAKD